MKKFEEVLDAIERDLKGKRLNSIRAGAELRIEKVDRANGRLQLRTSKGTRKTRPISELERIWAELCRKVAVHVDSFLGGSSSSRNQPETILANLPFVEWFYYKGKKHIAYVGEPTHKSATLQKMDSLRVEELKERLRREKEQRPLVCVFITDDITAGVKVMQEAGIPLKGLEPDIYEQVLPEGRHWLVARPVAEPGTYAVVTLRTAPVGAAEIELGGESFCLAGKDSIRRLVRVE